MKNLRRHNGTSNNHEELFYLKFAIVTGMAIILIVVSQINIFHSSRYRKSSPSVSCKEEDGVAVPEGCFAEQKIGHVRSTQRQNMEPSSANDEMLVLFLVTDESEANLNRALNRIIELTKGKGIPIAVSTMGTSDSIWRVLKNFPVYVIDVPRPPEYSEKSRSTFGGFVQEKINMGMEVFGNILGGNFAFARDSCPLDVSSSHINILNITQSKKEFVIYNFTESDEIKQNKVSFGNSKFNPNTQKIMKSKRNSMDSLLTNNPQQKNVCDGVHFVKRTLQVVTQKYPNFKNLLIVDDRRSFSDDLIMFFNKTMKVFEIDPSVYCISAHNSLTMKDSEPPLQELLRVDHFVSGGATLIPKKVVHEIIERYKVPPNLQEEIASSSEIRNKDPLKDVSDWLSWWKNRKLRGCVIPAAPRVCSIGDECPGGNKDINFNLQSLLRYKYCINLLHKLDDVTPLRYEQLPCNSNETFTLQKNKTHFAIYLKMDSLDDDITLHVMLKCFGIDHEALNGHFENVYTLHKKGISIFVLGVPYSRYGPTIAHGAKLYMYTAGELTDESMSDIVRHTEISRNTSLYMSEVPYEVEAGSQNTSDNKTKAS